MVKVFFTRTFDFGNIQNYSLFSEYRKKRLETISNPEKRKQSICAELLLCYASEQAGFPVPVDIFTTSNGKPACKHFHFSITHSHDLVAVAVSDETVGIDAEKIDLSKNISVKRKIFTPEEYENMDVYDFYRALHKATADSVIYFGNLVKKRYNGNMLTGSFYGSAACARYFDFSQMGYTYHILKSGVIDFLASPGVYENRQPGGFVGQRQCFDSFALNNRIFVCEDDTRTHHENAFYRNTMEMYDIDDTVNVIKREFARNLTTDIQAWWFDQHIGGGRYKDEDVYKLFVKQQKISKDFYLKDRRKTNEIAFIYDEESYHVVSEETTHQMMELFRNYEIDLIGAPSDRYFHNDMDNPDMPDYKLYVFVNTFYLTDAEREIITKKLKKNNATALFMYGSGCINPDNKNIFGPHNVSEFTGIDTKMSDEVVRGKFRFLKDNDLFTEGLDKYDIYGDFKRKMWANASGDYTRIKTSRVHMYPEFYAEDKNAKTCAYILENGHPALSVKECDGFTSVYCASKYLSSDIVRNIARFAGCHIYTDSDDVLYANKYYVAIHATKSGTKTIKLPQKCKVTEVYENKVYCENSDIIEFNLNRGETKMFEIG